MLMSQTLHLIHVFSGSIYVSMLFFYKRICSSLWNFNFYSIYRNNTRVFMDEKQCNCKVLATKIIVTLHCKKHYLMAAQLSSLSCSPFRNLWISKGYAIEIDLNKLMLNKPRWRDRMKIIARQTLDTWDYNFWGDWSDFFFILWVVLLLWIIIVIFLILMARMWIEL